MSLSEEYKVFLEDLFAAFGPITIRKMFGGGGLYRDGIMFALVANDRLYLKADETNRADFEDEGMKPFTYMGRGKPVRMSYWELPEALYDDPERLADLARKSFDVALKSGRKRTG